MFMSCKEAMLGENMIIPKRKFYKNKFMKN
jgi:hypothetical protein